MTAAVGAMIAGAKAANASVGLSGRRPGDQISHPAAVRAATAATCPGASLHSFQARGAFSGGRR